MYRYAALALVASVNATQLHVEAQHAPQHNWEALAQQAAEYNAAAQADSSQFDWNKLLDDAKKTVKGLFKAQTSPSAAQLAQI